MKKKSGISNLILLAILVILIVAAIAIVKNSGKNKQENLVEETIKLRAIGYGSTIQKFGYEDAGVIVNTFINGYNEHSGETVASNMDFVAMYIFSDCKDPEKEFDDKYVEYMRIDSQISMEEIIILQNTAKQQEDGLVESINGTNVQLEVIEYTEIEDVSKYLAKFKAKIRTVSADEGIDQMDWVEFWLLHDEKAYYIINYYNTGE